MPLTPAEFVERLDAISEYDGIPYGRAQFLLDEEERHNRAVLTYKGYLALSDAFKCFFLETVELLNTKARPKMRNPVSGFYSVFAPRLVHSFLSLCGAERIAICGYPYQAYTILRNVFDNLVLTSAALQKVTDFYSIEGLEPGKPFDINAITKLRKKTEFEVRAKMTGKKSGLSSSTLKELAKWDSLFDYEVHGARLSLAAAQGWMKGTDPLPILPKFNERQFALFMNRYCEVGWMAHRLIPLIRPRDVPFPDAWKRKWQVVDESFEVSVFSLTEQLGKAIGEAIVEFLKAKFPFDQQAAFPL